MKRKEKSQVGNSDEHRKEKKEVFLPPEQKEKSTGRGVTGKREH